MLTRPVAVPTGRTILLTLLLGVGVVACADSPAEPGPGQPGPSQPGPAPEELEGLYDLVDVSGQPLPVITVSTPEGAIRILSASLEVSEDSLRYEETAEHGVRQPDGSLEWGEPVTVEVPGSYALENGALIAFLQVSDDQILPLEMVAGEDELTIVVPADNGAGIAERRLHFRRRVV